MQNEQIQQIVDTAVGNLKQLAEVNTIIGRPLVTMQGETILPFSQVTLAFIAGGGEYGEKKKPKEANNSNQFAGGTGGGATLSPVGFLVIGANGVRMIKTEEQGNMGKLIDIASSFIKDIKKS